MGRRLLASRRVNFYPLEDARLPPARRGSTTVPIEEAIRSYFKGISGAYALDRALNLLELPIPRQHGGPRVQLTDALMAELFAGYCVRRAPDVLKGVAICYNANRWLSSRISTLRQVQTAIPEPIEALRRKESRERLAVNYTERVLRLFNTMTNVASQQVPAIRLWHVCGQPLKAWGILPDLPRFKSEERRDSFIAAHLARWLDAKWWARRLRKIWDQYGEQCAILLGHVRRGVSPYVSSQGLRAFIERQQMAAAWLKDMEAYNAQQEIIINLEDAVKASIAHPENRRHELVVRARGFCDVADELGYVGLFFTWTAPSRFHPWKTVRQSDKHQPQRTSENPKYQGQSPRDSQHYISALWQRCRSALARHQHQQEDQLVDDPIHYFGFRVVEPHHDGTPHWHLLVWVKPAHQHRMISILQRYALTHDQDDLVRQRHPDSKRPYSDITPRFDWKLMDKEKGGAVGYIVKYIAKNIDGYRVGDEGDLEAETAASDGARRVRAWASLWGLRQFQPLGGPPVGIWRELRRLPGRLQLARGINVAPLASPVMEACRRYADAADWKNFTQAMGGPCCPRADRPLRLHHITRETPNQYGEAMTRLLGVRARDGITQPTRIGDWVVRKRGSGLASAAEGGAGAGLDERSELVATERSEGLSPLGALAITVRGRKIDHFTEQIMTIQWGLDSFERGRLLAGATVSKDGYQLWLANGQLQSRRAIPNEPPWPPEDIQPAAQADADEYAIPAGDPDWPMLVRLCGEVYQVQGHAGAHRWIEMLPQPYQSEMWRVLDALDTPAWRQEQDDYSEPEWRQEQHDDNQEWV